MNRLPNRNWICFVLAGSFLASPALSHAQGRPTVPGRIQSIVRPPVQNLADGAKLNFDLGDANPTYTIKHITPPDLLPTKVRWDVSQVRSATAVVFEVARSPFGADRNPQSRPADIVSTQRLDGRIGVTSASIGQIAQDAGYLPPAPIGPRRLNRPDARQAFLNSGGYFSIYMRVVPIVSTANPTPIGLASPTLQIVYAKAKPTSLKIGPSPSASVPSRPAALDWLSLQYTPVKHYCFVHPSPSVCAKVGESKPWYEKTFSLLTDAWNWVAETYQKAKQAVIDLAASLLPFIPKEVFAVALDAAIAACGLPPNIPNLDMLMEQGADYLAGEVVAQVGPPAAGDLARAQIKKAILAGAKSAAKQLGSAGPDTPCQYRIDWPFVVLTVRNKTSQPVGPIYLSAWDWTGVFANNDWDGRLFRSYGQSIAKINPGASLPIFVPLMPEMRQRKHFPGGVHKESIYWHDYQTLSTELWVSLSFSADPQMKNLLVRSGKRPFSQSFAVKP